MTKAEAASAMKNPLAIVLAEKESAFESQYKFACAQVESAPESDEYWGDDNASLVAALNVSRAATLALEVIALRKVTQ